MIRRGNKERELRGDISAGDLTDQRHDERLPRVANCPQPLTPVRTGVVQSIATGLEHLLCKYSALPAGRSCLQVEWIPFQHPPGQGHHGKIRNIDQGDWVTKGTVLATVDQGDYKEKLQQANAQLARRAGELRSRQTVIRSYHRPV